jgi:hypothetical protein
MTMAHGYPAYDPIKAELAARIGLIGARIPGCEPADLAHEIDAIRSIAYRSGMHPAVTVAQALESALARGERGPLIHDWLAILSDAVDSEETDGAACSTYAAACSVRLTG